MPQSAIVVGGGIVGVCVALSLQDAGVETTLIDDGQSKPASWGNAGHLATEHVEPLASISTIIRAPKHGFWAGGALDFVWRDIATWLPWTARFCAAASPRRFSAGVAHLQSLAAEAFPSWHRLLGDHATQHLDSGGHFVIHEDSTAVSGRVDDGPMTWAGCVSHRDIDAAEKAWLRSHLNLNNVEGVRFSGTGQINDVGELLAKLDLLFAEKGGAKIHGCATRLERPQRGSRVVLATGQQYSADATVVAAGVWSKPLLQSVGINAPLIAERGYHIGFENKDWLPTFSPIAFPARSIVVTRFKTGMRATSFVEFGRADSAPDPLKWKRLERHLTELGLLQGGSLTRWMGARPTLPDYLPAIGGGEIPGIYYATGHAHLGLTLAPLTGELVRDMLLGFPTAIDLSPFRLERFR